MRFFAWLESRFVPPLRRFGDLPAMVAIREALPWSFVGLVAGTALFFFLDPHGTLRERFYRAFPAGFGVMAPVLLVLLVANFAKRSEVPRWLALAVAAAAFTLALPRPLVAPPVELAHRIGSSGLFLAMLVGLGAVATLRVARMRFGARAGAALGAAALLAVSAALFAAHLSLAAGLASAMRPLGNLGDSLTALLVITVVETLLWTAGIHGPALLAAVITPVYFGLQNENALALAEGKPLPHIVTISLFLFVFPGGAGATLPLVLLLLRSRVARLRKVAYATLVPSLFNANEPLLFGLPVVLNPVLALPFVVVPTLLALVTYFAVEFGFVGRTQMWLPSSLPSFATAFFTTGDWRAVVLIGLNIALGAAIYAPFVRAYERSEIERHGTAEAAAP